MCTHNKLLPSAPCLSLSAFNKFLTTIIIFNYTCLSVRVNGSWWSAPLMKTYGMGNSINVCYHFFFITYSSEWLFRYITMWIYDGSNSEWLEMKCLNKKLKFIQQSNEAAINVNQKFCKKCWIFRATTLFTFSERNKKNVSIEIFIKLLR